MPIIISAQSRQKACSVTRSGIGMPQPIVARAKWRQSQDKVEIAFIAETKCILVSKSTQSPDGFLISYANPQTKTGARIACQSFARNYLQAIADLPKKNLLPIIFPHDKWRLALILDELPW